jgi:hypothetical protein
MGEEQPAPTNWDTIAAASLFRLRALELFASCPDAPDLCAECREVLNLLEANKGGTPAVLVNGMAAF